MSYYRTVRTTQERRENGPRSVLRIDGVSLPSRPKRNESNLPHSYCDPRRGGYGVKCWKKYRRTQYRPVAVVCAEEIRENREAMTIPRTPA